VGASALKDRAPPAAAAAAAAAVATAAAAAVAAAAAAVAAAAAEGAEVDPLRRFPPHHRGRESAPKAAASRAPLLYMYSRARSSCEDFLLVHIIKFAIMIRRLPVVDAHVLPQCGRVGRASQIIIRNFVLSTKKINHDVGRWLLALDYVREGGTRRGRNRARALSG
jgi:hypothetical protein